MTVVYSSHASLFWSWKGTVLPRVWPLVMFTGMLSLALAAVYDDSLGAVGHVKLYVDSVEFTDPDATEVWANLMKGYNARA